jgi:Ca-activated chloride channel family protein
MMKRSSIENRFTELVDGSLSEGERLNLEKEIAADPALAQSFAVFKAIVATERVVAQEFAEPHSSLEVKVMERISEHGVRRESSGFAVGVYMALKKVARIIFTIIGSSAAGLVLLVALTVIAGLLFIPDEESVLNSALTVLEGSLGAILMLLAGCIALVTVATRRSRAALAFATMACALFCLRNLQTVYFNDVDIKAGIPVTPPEGKVAEGSHKPGQSGIQTTYNDVRIAPFGQSIIGGLALPEEQTMEGVFAPVDQETYSAVELAKRIVASDSAVSTFSIDVDTASYSNARRFLSLGQLPPKEAVRIEEFINYFTYNYPSQREKPFSLSYEIAPSPLSEGRYLLSLGIKARAPLKERRPWNLVFLVDVSGSMNEPNKLPLVQSSLSVVLDSMRPDDRIALVTYAGTSQVLLDSTAGAEKEKIRAAIKGLSAGGGTYGEGGIRAAYDVAAKNMIKDGVNRVILATDGDFNVGISSREELISLIEKKREGGVTLTTLGYGTGNIRDDVMEQLADKGNGNYFYIDSFREARRVLSTKLASTVEVVAKDVKLQVEFNSATIYEYRLIGYNNRILKKEDFNDDAVDAGEIGPDHTVTALYEVVLAGSPLAKKLESESRYSPRKEADIATQGAVHQEELGFLKVRFKEPGGTESELLEFPIERATIKDSFSSASEDFRWAAAVSGFAELLQGSTYAKGYDYSTVAQIADGALGEDADGARREFVELVNGAQSLRR